MSKSFTGIEVICIKSESRSKLFLPFYFPIASYPEHPMMNVSNIINQWICILYTFTWGSEFNDKLCFLFPNKTNLVSLTLPHLHRPFTLSLQQGTVINLFASMEPRYDSYTTKTGIVLAAQWVSLSLISWMNLRCICWNEIRGLPLMGQVSPRTEKQEEVIQLLRMKKPFVLGGKKKSGKLRAK